MASDDLGRRSPQRLTDLALPGDQEVLASKRDELLAILDKNRHTYTPAAQLARDLWPKTTDEKLRRQNLDSLLQLVKRQEEKNPTGLRIENMRGKGYRRAAQTSFEFADGVQFRNPTPTTPQEMPLPDFWERYTPTGLVTKNSHIITNARWLLEQYNGGAQRFCDLLDHGVDYTVLIPTHAYREQAQVIPTLFTAVLAPCLNGDPTAQEQAKERWGRCRQKLHIVLTSPRQQPEDLLFLNADALPAAQFFHIDHDHARVHRVKEGNAAFTHAQCIQEQLPQRKHVIDIQRHLDDPATHLAKVRDNVTNAMPPALHQYLDGLFAPPRFPLGRETARRSSRQRSA